MALTTDEQARLTALQGAYDNLISGQAVASVEYNGERTQYARVDPESMTRLSDAISALLAKKHSRRRGRALRFRL